MRQPAGGTADEKSNFGGIIRRDFLPKNLFLRRELRNTNSIRRIVSRRVSGDLNRTGSPLCSDGSRRSSVDRRLFSRFLRRITDRFGMRGRHDVGRRCFRCLLGGRGGRGFFHKLLFQDGRMNELMRIREGES